jgi:hypothetical protein
MVADSVIIVVALWETSLVDMMGAVSATAMVVYSARCLVVLSDAMMVLNSVDNLDKKSVEMKAE